MVSTMDCLVIRLDCNENCFNANFSNKLTFLQVIPESFLNYFVWKLSRTIKLEAHDDNVYDVGITELRNKTILRSGWEAFVDAQSYSRERLVDVPILWKCSLQGLVL